MKRRPFLFPREQRDVKIKAIWADDAQQYLEKQSNIRASLIVDEEVTLGKGESMFDSVVLSAITVARPAMHASSCNSPARLVRKYSPEEFSYPGPHPTGPTAILVWLSPSGKVLRTTVVKSGGVPLYDNWVRIAAARSTYEPATKRCKTIPSRYSFIAVGG